VLVSGIALTAAPLTACASLSRIALTGTLQQGSLLVGRTRPGSRVTVDDEAITVSPEGFFAWGLEWNRTAVARLSVRLPNGTIRTRRVLPIVRQYAVEIINGLPPETVTPPPDALDRIRHEHELIAAARRRESDLVWFADPLDWPAPGIVSGVFGSRRIDNGKSMTPHMGVDVANVEGTPIRAPANATVSLSDDFYLEGGFTLLDHGHGVSTCYLHQSRRMVKAGDLVQRGDVIGMMGQTGRATGPHLHWAMNWFQVKLDPSLSTRTALPPRT